MPWPWTDRPCRGRWGHCAPRGSCAPRRPSGVDTARDPDRGSAVVEFVALGLLLLVPVIYLVVTVARVQAGSFAVVAASEQAAQAISVLEVENMDRDRVHAVAALAARDQGFDEQDLSVQIGCSDGACSGPGTVVTVHTALRVNLPTVPGFATATVANLASDITVVSGRYS